jgi:protein TonB
VRAPAGYTSAVSETLILAELAAQHEAEPPAGDRLLTATFLVGVLYALLILGVTFSLTAPPPKADGPTLEVLLVHNPVAEGRINTAADYLANVNQQGSGTEADVRHAESPHATPSSPSSDAPDDDSSAAAPAAGSPQADMLATAAAARDRRYFGSSAAPAKSQGNLVLDQPDQEMAGADSGAALHLRGRTKRELLVTANTRESTVAVYLDGWRHKIERIGTLNYPLDAARRAGLSGSPVLEVQILANGRLGGVWVQRSSGHPELDAAAVAILKLAAPFDAFPKALAAQHDALRLAYEWQFLGGELHDSTVRLPAATR